MITAHTDVVGSLLRPVALRKARDDWVAGRLSHAQFKSIEDRAVDEAVSLQEAAGLDIVTDGEMRRLSFQSQMTEAVDGSSGSIGTIILNFFASVSRGGAPATPCTSSRRARRHRRQRLLAQDSGASPEHELIVVGRFLVGARRG